MAKNKGGNLLDYIPKIKESQKFTEDENGIIVLTVEWKGFFHTIAHKFFKKPKVSKISLDELGSYVWKQIDGEKSLMEIAALVGGQFGDEPEIAAERLIKFVRILLDNEFIELAEKNSEKKN